MKLKLTILALSACTIAILPAQTPAPQKPPMVKEIKAETPVEKQAFKIFDILGTLPDILGPINDDATLATAKAQLSKMFENMEIEEAILKKLQVPDNDARKKISAKLDIKQKGMEAKMLPVMMAMQKLPLATTQKIGPLMREFGVQMSRFEPTLKTYFRTDEEKKKQKGK